MTRACAILASAILACAVAPAATITTTLTVNGTASLGASGFSITGTTAMTGGIGNGTISASVPITGITSDPVVATYTITLAAGGTLTGTLSVPLSVLTGGATSSASVKLTVTGGTGTYAGATTGATPINLTGGVSGGIATGFTLTNFTGSGTITTGGTVGPTPPTISAVLDSASNTPTVAQGSIFIVKGSTLCPSGTKFFDLPRPTVAPDGVKITFTPTAGGAGTDSILVYEFNPSGVCQLAAILPSTVAPGNYNVTVTNGTASAPFAAQVVPRKPTLFTQDSSGSGLASVQNFISQGVVDLNSFTTGLGKATTISPAKPGQFLIAYGTGLGPLVGGDNTASPSHDFNTDSGLTIRAIVGGTSIPVAFAGRAGFAGEDQINFALPANVTTGCAVPFQISVNGALSNPTFIAIAPDVSSTTCVLAGFSPQQLKDFDNGATITTGGFSITQFTITLPSVGTVKSNSIGGGIAQLTGFQLASAGQVNPTSVIQSGSCQVIQSTSSGTTASPTGSLTYLDAGTVSINGPAGSSLSNLALTKTNNIYSISSFEGLSVPIPGQTNFSLPAGPYTLSGAGGPDVGSFNTSLTLGSPLTVTGGLPTAITRSAGLTLNWTGGNASDLVEIIGGSSTTTGTGTSAILTSSTFICLTTAGQRTFTVPASVLNQLPATTGTNTGLLEVASGTSSSTFTATLPKAGGSTSGVFASFLGIGATPTYQ